MGSTLGMVWYIGSWICLLAMILDYYTPWAPHFFRTVPIHLRQYFREKTYRRDLTFAEIRHGTDSAIEPAV